MAVIPRKRTARRHVIGEGYIGEWNLPDNRPLAWAFLARIKLFGRAKEILGARRRKGLRAVRVRLVVEEFR